MRKGIKGLLMLSVIMITFSIFCLNAKAAERSKISITKLTQTSVDIDYRQAIEDEIAKSDSDPISSLLHKFPIVKVTCHEFHDGKEGKTAVYESEEAIRDLNLLKDSITGLKPRTQYRITVTYKFGINEKEKSLLQTFITPDSDTDYKIKQAGCTDTSITIDLREAYKLFYQDVKKRGETVFSSSLSPYIGYAKKTGSNNAREEAWDMATNGNNYMDSSAYYTIKGLDPSSKYSACVMLEYRDSKTKNQYMAYFSVDEISTGAKGNYAEMPYKKKYNTNNTKVDSYMKQCGNIPIYGPIKLTATENSITIDWSGLTGDSAIKNVALGCVLYSNIDLEKDKEEYGSVNNAGPYIRAAYKMCDDKKISLADSVKSYTFKNLEAANHYAIAIKYTDKKGKTTYRNKKVRTEGSGIGFTNYNIGALQNREYQSCYMYDAKTYKEGNCTIVDWTDALDAYLSQDFWKKMNARLCENSITYIGYEETTVDSYNREYSYNCTPSDWTASIASEYCAKKARIYGLDPDKKYVFCISTRITCFYKGEQCEDFVIFYADETGTNYNKLQMLGQDKTTRDNIAKMAALKNKGVLNIDISEGDCVFAGEEAWEVLTLLKAASKKVTVLEPLPYQENNSVYNFDLNGDKIIDLKCYLYDWKYWNSRRMKFVKAEGWSIKENEKSFNFDDKTLYEVKLKAVDEEFNGYYSGINFIFKKTPKAEDKKDDSVKKEESKKKSDKSSKTSNDKTKDNSKKKSDSKSNKDSNSKKNKADSKSGKNGTSSKSAMKGSKITYKGYRYEITSSNTVKLLAPTNKSVETVSVPSRIKYFKKNYKVTEIGDSAFKGCKKLQKVTISSNIKVIGKKAFYGCKKLKTVEIKSKNLKKVGKKAFDKTSKNLKISVPKKKLKNYKSVLKKAGVKSGKLKSTKK